LLRAIRLTVQNLLIASETTDTEIPMLCDWLQVPLGRTVLTMIYGSPPDGISLEVHVTSQDLNLLSHSTQTSRPYIDLAQILQIMLAAVISEWILEKKHDAVPHDPTKKNLTWIASELQRSESPSSSCL
jgi:hypothetical protein